MNMHGIMTPISQETRSSHQKWLDRVWLRMRRMRGLLLVVVLPTLLAAGYYFLIAADEYQSEAHFVVRAAGESPVSSSGFGQLLGISGGISSSQGEAMSVADYLTSHDAVDTLGKRVDLVAMFRRPEADLLSRIWSDRPTPESLLKFYRGRVGVHYNPDTAITTLTVRAFRPGDAHMLAGMLLAMGEQRVNALNQRSYQDAVATSARQLGETESAAAALQGQMTRFRQSHGDIDPQASGEAQIRLVSTLSGNLSAARAQLSAMGGTISPSSPQYVALVQRVRALASQLASQSGKLAGGGQAIASDLGGYEGLRVRQEFMGKRYEAAAASFEKARADAQKQQLYLVRIVDANMPVKSEFPERWRILGTLFAGLMLVYGIGWLIAAGVREHAA